MTSAQTLHMQHQRLDPFGRPLQPVTATAEQHQHMPEPGVGLGQFRAPARSSTSGGGGAGSVKHRAAGVGGFGGGFNNPELHAFAQPRAGAVSFDMGQPYAISTVTGTAFDIGTPTTIQQHGQRPSVTAAALPSRVGSNNPSATTSMAEELEQRFAGAGIGKYALYHFILLHVTMYTTVFWIE